MTDSFYFQIGKFFCFLFCTEIMSSALSAPSSNNINPSLSHKPMKNLYKFSLNDFLQDKVHYTRTLMPKDKRIGVIHYLIQQHTRWILYSSHKTWGCDRVLCAGIGSCPTGQSSLCAHRSVWDCSLCFFPSPSSLWDTVTRQRTPRRHCLSWNLSGTKEEKLKKWQRKNTKAINKSPLLEPWET